MAALTNTTKEKIERYAKVNGLDPKECARAYAKYWDWVRSKVSGIGSQSGLNRRMFHDEPTGVDVEGLGVFDVPFVRYEEKRMRKRIKEQYKHHYFKSNGD